MKGISVIGFIFVGYDRKQCFPLKVSFFVFIVGFSNFVISSLAILIRWRVIWLLIYQSLFGKYLWMFRARLISTYHTFTFDYLKIKKYNTELDMIYLWQICAAYFNMWKHFSLGSWGESSISLAIYSYFNTTLFFPNFVLSCLVF